MVSLWVVFSASVALSVATTVDDCPANLIRDESLQVSNGDCFYFAIHKPREYNAAKESCKHNGGTLALVKTEKIQDFLYNHLTYTYGYKGHVFIGLNDVQEEGKFMWEDGTPLGKWQNWAPGYGPEDAFFDSEFSFLRDCVTLDTQQGGKWVDNHCESHWYIPAANKRPFICQFKATAKSTTPKPTSPKPTTSKPTTPKLTTLKPTTTKPTTSKPTSPKHTTPKLTTPKLITPKPTTLKPTTSKPTTSKPTTSKPRTLKQTTLKPTTPRLLTKKSTTLQPTCPPFVCATDCSMDGYKTYPLTGCAVCECDV